MNGHRTILIVDDEEVILHSLRMQLEDSLPESFTVEIASNAEEALEFIAELHAEGQELSLLICDYNIDGVKGTTVLSSAVSFYPGLTKVLLTGQEDNDEIRSFISSVGLDLRLNKPWDIHELRQLIDNLKC